MLAAVLVDAAHAAFEDGKYVKCNIAIVIRTVLALLCP